MTRTLLILATGLQAIAVGYGVFLVSRRRGATWAWLFLLGAMLSMLVWRGFVMTGTELPGFFNPLIAVWGSSCMLAAMLFFAREVARRERAEAERDELLASERAARTEAERANRLKDEFLATLSHELRTPLAAILGWCTILQQKGTAPADAGRAIDVIERNARAQTRLVDDLLDATRIQAGTLQLDLGPVQLDGPVRSAIEAVRPNAEAKGLSLRLRCEGDPPVVVGDAGRLQQVVCNLLVNAVKFTPSGGSIEVCVTASADRAEIVVRDDGEGIDAEFLPHLFTRFRQADSSVARRHGGLGLGLAIVASLVRLHGGEVHADSDGPGRGATFSVTLPLEKGATRPTPPVLAGVEAVSTRAERPLAGMRIVVVDDEADVRGAVSGLLEQMGVDVVALETGAAIESYLASLRPHLLLIDIGLPGEDGYALIRRIRALPPSSGGDVPAVSLTAHARNEDRARAIASGFQEHLPKPIDVPLLIATARRLSAPSEVQANGVP